MWLTGFYNMAFLAAVAVVVHRCSRSRSIGLFTPRPGGACAWGATCLRVVSYGYVFYAWGMVMVQAFNGAGDTTTPTWINLVCYWMFQIPLAWTLARTLGMGPHRRVPGHHDRGVAGGRGRDRVLPARPLEDAEGLSAVAHRAYALWDRASTSLGRIVSSQEAHSQGRSASPRPSRRSGIGLALALDTIHPSFTSLGPHASRSGHGTAERNRSQHDEHEHDSGRARRRGRRDPPEPRSAGVVRTGLNGVANGRAREWHARSRETPGRGNLQPGQGQMADGVRLSPFQVFPALRRQRRAERREHGQWHGRARPRRQQRDQSRLPADHRRSPTA